MTTSAAQIIDAAAFTLQDATNVQWTRAELLGYVSDAQRDACLVKPDAYTVNAPVVLVAGTKQAIPANGNAFVRIARNMGVSPGATPGRAPRQIEIDAMDQQNPNWHTQTASAVVMEYLYDARDPKTFYVSPPQPSSAFGYVDLVYHAAPAAITLESDTMVIDDIYKTALVHYVVYRAYLKEGELSNATGAAAHRGEFLALLGAKEAAEEVAKPKWVRA